MIAERINGEADRLMIERMIGYLGEWMNICLHDCLGILLGDERERWRDEWMGGWMKGWMKR